MYDNLTQELCEFIQSSPSCYHVVENLRKSLTLHGFTELKESGKWKLERGQGYFVTRNDSSIISFRVPKDKCEAFHIAASHSDSPTFKIKPSPEITANGIQVKLNIEKYGGMLCATWFDRPLSVAGRVFVEEKTEEGKVRLVQKLIDLDQDLLIIPSLAIHMNRDANTNLSFNVQKDMLPLFTNNGDAEGFRKLVAYAAGVDSPDKVLGSDLFLVNRMQPTIWGVEEEFISSPKLDDLECCYGTFRGFLDAAAAEEVSETIMPMHCVFDNEETGSMSRQGAQSTFLKDTLERIVEATGMSFSKYHRALANSFVISADNAHAVHPNFADKADPVNRPMMNKGIVVKYHANQKYTTDGASEAIFKFICKKNEIPFQEFVNRSDMAGGSTLGNISNTQVSIRTVDIGLAQLAMHSSYETAGAEDPAYLAEFSRAFFAEELPEIG